jgi:aminoglycoside/choline kinase family phosphotransferase
VDILKCWWSDSNSEQGIVILDDLNKQGATFGEPTETWSVDQVKAGVEQLAGLHAGTWGAKSADLPSWLTDPEHYDSTILTLCSWWQGLVVGESRPHFPADWNEERITAAMKKHLKSRDPRFSCLLHGDPHAGNTYFINGAPRFLDWQLIHVGSAFHDFAYFVVGALSVEDRKAHEMSILQHYLDALAKFGGPTLQQDDVLIEYRKSLLSGIGWMLTPYKLQTMERVHAMSERYGSAILDHKSIELIESL